MRVHPPLSLDMTPCLSVNQLIDRRQCYVVFSRNGALRHSCCMQLANFSNVIWCQFGRTISLPMIDGSITMLICRVSLIGPPGQMLSVPTTWIVARPMTRQHSGCWHWAPACFTCQNVHETLPAVDIHLPVPLSVFCIRPDLTVIRDVMQMVQKVLQDFTVLGTTGKRITAMESCALVVRRTQPALVCLHRRGAVINQAGRSRIGHVAPCQRPGPGVLTHPPVRSFYGSRAP